MDEKISRGDVPTNDSEPLDLTELMDHMARRREAVRLRLHLLKVDTVLHDPARARVAGGHEAGEAA